MNAANELAVEAFLKEKIGFLDIPGIIEETLSKVDVVERPGFEELCHADAMARTVSKRIID